MEALNLSNLTVDSSGRASFSGLSSGVDFASAVDSIIAAKHIPIDTLQSRITGNEDKIAALTDFKALLQTLKNATSSLRGAVSVDGAGNTFKNKLAFASASRTDGQTPSPVSSLLGATVTNAAATGSHEIEIRRTATAHKISSQSFSSPTTALGLSGSFTISNGATDKTITVAAGDTLLDIRDRINNTNTGTSPSGATASVVTVTSGTSFLIITKDDAGADLVITDSGNILSGLGLSSSNGAGGHRNGLATGSKIASASGFRHILFDGTQSDNSFLISYDSTTRVLTLTRGDGVTDTATLASGAIAAGAIETATFSKFGATIDLDSSFDKTTSIVVDPDTASVTGGTGAITASSITITDSVGDVSAISSSALTFSNFTGGNNITITAAGGFTATGVDLSTAGAKTVTLSDGAGNSITVQFTVATAFDGTETAASIDLQELENFVGTSGTPFSNVLQTAQKARFTADGLIDNTHFESQRLASSTTSIVSSAGSFDIVGTGTATINYVSGETLTSLAGKINAQTGTTGVTATVVADGAGFRIDLDSSAAFTLTDTSGLLTSLGVNNDLVLERATNTVSDVFSGVTLSLFQAEQGTKIKIDVERDLTAVKSAITGFVDAYNAVRVFVNTQDQTDAATGLSGADSGVLFGDSVMNGIRDQLANIIGFGTVGVSNQFSALSQIGVNFVKNSEQSDATLFDTLEIDETKLDAALLSNPEDIRRLFSFDFASSDPSVSLVDFAGTTSYSATGYTLNIGTVGLFDQNSVSVIDRSAILNTANSAGATVSGTFDVNGVAVAYDVTTDSLNSLATAINNAAIPGVTAQAISDSSGAHLAVNSATNPLVINNDTGDLLAKLNFTPDNNIIDSANIGGASNGADDGSVTVSGRVLTVTNSSGAEGLKLFYTGPASTSGIQLDFTIGVAPPIFFGIDNYIDETNGSIQGEIDGFNSQNEFAKDRITSMESRLDTLKASLTARFVAAEQALARMQNALDSIKQFFDVLTNQNN
ncbi:MAG: flagellar filament capping protein FliD [Alphaproteobacteria bacterium]